MQTHLDLNFTSMILSGNQLLPNTYSLRFELSISTDINERDYDIIKDRIKILYALLSTRIFTSYNNAHSTHLNDIISNDLIILPEEPYDQIVGTCLMLKTDAIMEDKAKIISIQITSTLAENITLVIMANDKFVLSIHGNKDSDILWYNHNNLVTNSDNEEDIDKWGEYGLEFNPSTSVSQFVNDFMHDPNIREAKGGFKVIDGGKSDKTD